MIRRVTTQQSVLSQGRTATPQKTSDSLGNLCIDDWGQHGGHLGKTSLHSIPGSIPERLRAGLDSHDGLTRFLAPRQAGKGSILQETFLVADTRVEVLLGMPFLTLSSADIRFAEVLVWRTFSLYDKPEKV